jgi:hypothetical protein
MVARIIISHNVSRAFFPCPSLVSHSVIVKSCDEFGVFLKYIPFDNLSILILSVKLMALNLKIPDKRWRGAGRGRQFNL